MGERTSLGAPVRSEGAPLGPHVRQVMAASSATAYPLPRRDEVGRGPAEQTHELLVVTPARVVMRAGSADQPDATASTPDQLASRWPSPRTAAP